MNSEELEYFTETNYTFFKKPMRCQFSKDISNLIGTSRPTLNLLLNELKHEGIINFNRKTILLLKYKIKLKMPLKHILVKIYLHA